MTPTHCPRAIDKEATMRSVLKTLIRALLGATLAGPLAATTLTAAMAQDMKPGVVKRGPDGQLYLDTTGVNTAPPARAGNASRGRAPAPPVRDPQTLFVCPSGCAYSSIREAFSNTANGDTVAIGPGTYHEAAVIRANGVTLKASPGAHIHGAAAERKAALVVKGNDTVIEGLECSGIAVGDHNGACIRLEGINLTLRSVHFHDSEQGILTGQNKGTVIVEDSLFENLGARGRAHGLYIGRDTTLIMRRSRVLSSQDQGHEIKVRGPRTLIEDSVIASLDGNDSRLIDASNGGEVVIRNSVLESGPASVNHEFIGMGMEGVTYPDSSLLIEGCTILVDRKRSKLTAGPISPTYSDTRVVGGREITEPGVTWFPTREAANLPPYPALPDPLR